MTSISSADMQCGLYPMYSPCMSPVRITQMSYSDVAGVVSMMITDCASH